MSLNVPRQVRLMLAAMLTLLMMPCFGFGVFGFMASGEPGGNNLLFRVGYALFLVLLLVGIIALWRISLRTWRRDLDSVCSGCGYDLRANKTGPCPECGRDRSSDEAF
mgnify:CR=1 FL=1